MSALFSTTIQIGKIGEHLTCAELFYLNLYPSLAECSLPYDILLDTGRKILKIQVKTVSKPTIIKRISGIYNYYSFNLRRHGRYNSKNYEDDIDIFALVNSTTKEVGFIEKINLDILQFKIDSFKGQYYNEIIYERKRVVDELSKTLKDTEIANKMNISLVQVRQTRRLSNYSPQIRYFSEIKRDREWFLTNF